ncbi:flagellar basal body-associated protein FliL [Sulfurimonas sp.]|jgi:flagellar FliL protein|uniref:flagellar basal body-associated protein FliL n=1 Tax=Sulfurimonas sp. TaxID=2022749 RepID=UPI0025EC6281|nr:flagellar basal body-associated protein FliL [Sulfurimonas sp.]MCK9473976.1 flagellar basal body-associated protein FliL [Sulfurimonas sp.]MDD3505922.1 flagellar basal body-associated protein FliL [Sulfurimonas sp.]
MAAEESKEEKKKSSKMLMIIIIVVLVLIVIAGAIVTVLLLSEDDKSASIQQNTSQQVQQTQQSTSYRANRDSEETVSRKLSEIGILYPLDTFTVNLKSDAGRRYLKATISLELNGKELTSELDNKSPVVRDRIIRILTSKTLEEISSKKGKQKVSEQIIDTLNSMITDGSIKGIYFTEFVIQ